MAKILHALYVLCLLIGFCGLVGWGGHYVQFWADPFTGYHPYLRLFMAVCMVVLVAMMIVGLVKTLP